MGVPGFYRWLCQRYPLIRRRLDDPSKPRFNNLYIDLNGIIYRAISATNFKGPLPTTDFLSELSRYIDLLVQVIKPSDLIFLAVDGTAPFAKAKQQRERRFVASASLVPGSFDRTAITPGTEFMLEVHNHLLSFISQQRGSDLSWSKPKVIYSSVFVPGEGEHKIMDYIRENRPSDDWNPNQVHCIYSSDADLLFLSLQTHEPYFVVLREIDAVFFKQDTQPFEAKTSSVSWGADAFEIVHLSMVREYLQLDFDSKDDLEMLIDDFIAISFLIGNDFIPFFSDVDIRNGSYDDILSCYKRVRLELPDSYLVTDGKFNKPFMKQLLQSILDVFKKRYKKDMQLDVSDEEIAARFHEKNRDYILQKYPEHEKDFDEFIKDMSDEILDAFDWVLKYYNEGCPSWTWFYPYHYAPPLEFIIPYIDEHESHFDEGMPNGPLLHLLALMPPQSKELLPEVVQTLMDDEELKDFYPTTFETDLNGRRVEWQATVLIPFIDLELLKEKFNEIDLPDEFEERNSLAFPIEFSEGLEYEDINITKGEMFEPVLKATETPSCIPTLADFDYKWKEKVVPVKLFEHPSTKPSLLIKVKREPQTVKDVIDQIGTTVLINWPYLMPATVTGAFDAENKYDPATKQIIPKPQNMNFPAVECRNFIKTNRAVDLGNISVFLTVIAQNNDGTFEQRKNHQVPINLVVPVSKRPNVLDNFKAPEVRQPEIGETVVFCGGIASGFVGEILSRKEGEGTNNKYYKVKVHQKLHPPTQNFFKDDKRKWVDMKTIINTVRNISFKALRYALSQIILSPFNVNIALTLFTNDNKVLDGCCKYEDRNYIFASFIPDLVVQYFNYTGNLKTILMDSYNKKETKLPKITLEMLFGGNEQHQNECYEKLIKWLTENAPAVKYPLVTDFASFLSNESLTAFEKSVSTFKFITSDKELDDYEECNILWRSKPNPKPLSSVPRIGNRIVSIATSGPATYGEIGTVIETDPKTYSVTVLFDNELPCGTRLEGRLATNRGIRMNITDIYLIG